MNKRVVFFGNERLATAVTTEAPTLQRLIEEGYDVVAVVSHHTAAKSRSDRGLEIAAVAEKHDIPLLLPKKPADIIDKLRSYDATIGVLVAYGKIVPQSVIDVFPAGIVNIHPSLLPLHRGPIPIESVILEGAAETGVSVMRLAQAMDAGPVYSQQGVTLGGSETKRQLADSLLSVGGQLLLDSLPDIIDGSLQPRPQDDSRATYDKLIMKADGVLDFSKPAVQLAREVRAYSGWPQSRTTLHDMDVIIIEAHAEKHDTSGALGTVWRSGKQFGVVATGGVLVIERLKPLGKSEMSAEAFLAGYSKNLT